MTPEHTAARTLVIGIGNPDRGDDGVGPLVARRLLDQLPPDVAIIERTGDALALIDDWAGRDVVILVDAAVSGANLGCVHRIDLLTDVLAPEFSLSSTHAFGVAQAVGLAGALGLLPAQVIAFAIEGGNFEPGAPISPEVAAAADQVVSRVVDELRRLAKLKSATDRSGIAEPEPRQRSRHAPGSTEAGPAMMETAPARQARETGAASHA